MRVAGVFGHGLLEFRRRRSIHLRLQALEAVDDQIDRCHLGEGAELGTTAGERPVLEQLVDRCPTAADREVLAIARALLDAVPLWLNVHPSLLPLYRGATPIQSAIRDGRSVTAVSAGEPVAFPVQDAEVRNLIASLPPRLRAPFDPPKANEPMSSLLDKHEKKFPLGGPGPGEQPANSDEKANILDDPEKPPHAAKKPLP